MPAPESPYRSRSLWLDGLPGALEPRPALAADESCDVAIVGAGFTGLWTAYYLAALQPQLRIVVVEREIAGFGASGRNGGWASGFMTGDPALYAHAHGADAVLRAERETFAAVGEIGRVAAAEGIDCGFRHDGSLSIAFSGPQLARLQHGVAGKHGRGLLPADLRMLEAGELERYVRVPQARGASFTPHCARVDPARLARGLADACERRGVAIYERTAALQIGDGRVVCEHGTLSAPMIVRATESFTIEQPGEARRFLPLYSLMVATEPLSDAVWDELGWHGCETISDAHHLFFYAQRTIDGRIAIGGRGAPYRLGSPIDASHEQNAAVRERLVSAIRAHFPAAASAEITHHWGGPLAVPRDWSMAISIDRERGVAFGGGYSGHGVVAANVSGRTLADLILERESDLVTLPWVGHRSRRWEPEPLRFLASRAIVAVLGSSDRFEDRTDRPARRTRLVQPFVLGR